ncbi:MAG: hypothetical protein E6Q99_08810 [Elusimicrobia bacterium]|nr:MAG: hypothetical protein E6Q99_08810 [Elusimicrobiota bacterium]
MRLRHHRNCLVALAVLGGGLSLPEAALAQSAPEAATAPPLSSPPTVTDPAYTGATESPSPTVAPPPVGLPYRVDYMAPVRYEQRPRIGLAIAGGAVFGGLYLASTIVASFIDDKSLAVPIVGPFIEMGMLASASGSSSSSSSLAPVQFALFMNGLAQAAGVAMLIAGLATKQKVALYRPRFCVSPYTAQAGGGLVASGRF